MSDNWDFYIVNDGVHPVSRFVDLGVKGKAPVTGQSRLVVLTLSLLAPDDSGMAGDAEYQRLLRIEDAITSALRERRENSSFVGRSISEGFCEYYVYAADGQAVEALFTGTMTNFDDYSFTTGCRDDAGWDFYLHTLFPNDGNLQIIRNGRILRHLTEHGDNHHLARPVLHQAYFANGEDRKHFIAAVAARGFTPQREDRVETSQGWQYRVRVARNQTLEFDAINTSVLEMLRLAQECNGKYDGWEAAVVTVPQASA